MIMEACFNCYYSYLNEKGLHQGPFYLDNFVLRQMIKLIILNPVHLRCQHPMYKLFLRLVLVVKVQFFLGEDFVIHN